LGVGNGNPWIRRARSQDRGDNLFLSSIVALDGRTGEHKWHYQVSPGDTWDHEPMEDMELADLVVAGKLRKVLMQASKNGFLYVIDRGTGELISAEPYAKVTWASRIDLKTGRPVENPGVRYSKVMWSFSAHASLIAPPASYAANGRQYVTVLTGLGTGAGLQKLP
jgi:quinohemoprotein ethanol dehydrogenase